MQYPFVDAPGLHSTSFSMLYTPGGGIQEWDKCLYLHVWGDWILSTSKNATPVVDRNDKGSSEKWLVN